MVAVGIFETFQAIDIISFTNLFNPFSNKFLPSKTNFDIRFKFQVKKTIELNSLAFFKPVVNIKVP